VKRLLTLLASILAVVAYPALVHVASVMHSPMLAAAATLVLAALLLAPALRRPAPWAWGLLLVIGAGLVLLAQRPAGLWLPLYLPPVLLPALIAVVFGRTLRAGRKPLTLQFAEIIHGPDDPLPPTVAGYARNLNIAWTALLASIASVSLVLALIAVPEGILQQAGFEPALHVRHATWSLFANVLNYLVIGGFVILEHAYRRMRFPEMQHHNLAESVRRMAAAAPRLLGKDGHLERS